MTREEALRQYVDAEIMINQLLEKKQNLKKIILAEIVTTPQLLRQVEQPKRIINRSGETEAIVAKVLHDHGGKLSQQEIATLSGLRATQVNGVIYKLLKKNIVHRHQGTAPDNHVYFSIAVHKDRSELNHL